MNILVIANDVVHDSLDLDGARVCVVAPALNSRLRHWLSDVDASLGAAEQRLAQSLANLGAGSGWVGDADPVQAVADALHFFDADAIAVVGDAHWLARDLPRRLRDRFGLPIVQAGKPGVESTRPSDRMLIAS